MDSREAAFNTLIDRDGAMLRGAALRILGNVSDADEAIQNALLAAWRKFDAFRNTAALSSWVYRITVNSCYDLLRRKRREEFKQKKYAEEKIGSTDAVSAAEKDRLEELERAVAELPTLYREALAIGFLSGMPAEKAAAILGCSTNTLYQRIHKAKELLRRKFRESANE